MPLTVALPEPRWLGHHPTYFREFVASLLRNQCHVLALCAGHEEIASEMEDQGQGNRVTTVPLTEREESFLFPGREHDPVLNLSRWLRVRSALHQAERLAGRRADLVFFPFLDSMLRFQLLPGAGAARVLGRPWAGLYFRNHHFSTPGAGVRYLKGDHTLRARGCVAAGALDERHIPAMEAHAPGTPVFQWPDITDETPPAGPTAFTSELGALAKGRPVVGMIGMERRKGTLTLLKAATQDARLRNFFFAFTGDFYADSYSPAELHFAETIAAEVAAGKHDHIYFKAERRRIPDGVEFNTLFSFFDIVYAAYEGFHGSSNTLTKSSLFHRPVVATAGGCVGQRVERYRLGATIPEGDVAAAAEAILALGSGGSGDPPLYHEYHSQHNRTRLDRCFARVLGLAGKPERETASGAFPAATPA